ncbi:MAG: M56 family metallopeptidase [Pirellulales bacterium]|nr:M56 family metallopeptidase [Pirellulales bacterium]
MTELYESLFGPLGQRLTWTLIHFLWQGLGVVLLLSALLWAFRVRQAAIRYACSVFAMLAMAACLPITFVVLKSSPPAASAVDVVSAREVSWVVGRGSSVEEAMPDAPRLAAAGTAAPSNGNLVAEGPLLEHPSPAKNVSRPTTNHQRPTISKKVFSAVQPHLLIFWFLGVFLLSVRLSMGLLGTRRLGSGKTPVPAELARRTAELARKLGLRRIPRAFGSFKIGEAVALGFLRPMILLPAAWLTEMPPEVLTAVIAHELAHIRRFDLWVNLFQRLIETLLFYHPAVWWLSRRIRLEREMCCDELAVRATGQRVAYAEALHQVAQRAFPPLPATVAAIGGKNKMLLKRIQYVLGVSPAHDNLRWWPAGLLALLAPAIFWLSLVGCTKPTGEDAISSEAKATERAAAEPETSTPEMTYEGKTLEQWKRLAATELKTETRKAALDVLPEFGPRGIDALADLLKSGSVSCRREIVHTLVNCRPPQDQESLSRKKIILTLLTALDDKDRQVRLVPLSQLGNYAQYPEGQELADRIVRALARALTDPSPEIELMACSSLSRYGPKAKEAVPGLIAIFKRYPSDPDVAKLKSLPRFPYGPFSSQDLPQKKYDALLEALRALAEIGPAAQPAIPELKAFSRAIAGSQTMGRDVREKLIEAAETTLKMIQGEKVTPPEPDEQTPPIVFTPDYGWLK